MPRLHRLVLLVALAGAAACAAASALLREASPVLPHELPHGVLLAGVLAVAVVADLAHVRVRRGSEAEDLTMLEAALVPAVLLLPAAEAVWVPVVAVLTTSVLQRRAVLKAAFNVGSAGAAAAASVALVHAVSGPGVGLRWPTVVGLVAGLLAYAAVDLLTYARLLAVLGEREVRHVVRDGARLAAISTTATVSVVGSAVLAATAAPALLPFCAVPAAALLVALRATATAAEQRERGEALLALSRVLAGRDSAEALVPAFLAQCRQVFDADVALLVPPPGSGRTVVDARRDGGHERAATDAERVLSGALAGGVLPTGLPDGCSSGVFAPLAADGQQLGTLVLGTTDRRRPLREDQLPLLVPLASALAVALQGAAQSRRLVEATSRLQAVVDQSSDGILVLDGAGTVELWSPALEALTGVPASLAEGRPLPSSLAPADRGIRGAGAPLLTPASPRATVELVVQRPDGQPRTVRCAHAAVFESGALVRDVVLVHDVTREREVERLKADFVATVSHELRTPVTPIKGYADLLRRRGDDMTPERRQECLAVIVDRCDHLARLVEDLLLTSQISATEGFAQVPVSLGRHDLGPLVRRTAAQAGADPARLRVCVPSGPLVATCDPVRTGQLLAHLLDNALKYSPPQEAVDVHLEASDGQAVLTVTDRGRGIPADQVERVFEKFSRLEDPLRMTTGGAGLGLYLARHLATAMGGELTCRSALGSGSTFRLVLPVADGARPHPQTPGDGARELRRAAWSPHAHAGLR